MKQHRPVSETDGCPHLNELQFNEALWNGPISACIHWSNINITHGHSSSARSVIGRFGRADESDRGRFELCRKQVKWKTIDEIGKEESEKEIWRNKSGEEEKGS